MLFRNHYRCPDCGQDWTDDWSATCDDDCPHCGARHITPVTSEDLFGDEATKETAKQPVHRLRPATGSQAGALAAVLGELRAARDQAKAADCPAVLKKIRSALKSAEGAQRHMARRLQRAAP